MDVGGMTFEEEKKTVEDYIAAVSNESVTLQVGKQEKSFPMAEIGLACSNPEVINEAYDYGKKGNLFERIKMVYGLTKTPKTFPLTFYFDEAKAREKIISVEKEFLAKKKNATIKRKKGKFKVTKEVNGIDMDLEKNADKLIGLLMSGDWDEKSIVFPLDYKEDKAEHTKAELSVIKDKLGTFTTSYGGSPAGRCVNVANGARLINGTLLYPGDKFSVHDAVTPFNKENGYRLAGSYENGTTVQTYGGGICQVSTTLYNAVLRSELEVLERSNHSMTVHYVELSEDAAISGDQKDFRFKNSLDHPIYIVGSTNADKQTITFTIYGKEYRDKDRSIEFVSETTSTRPPEEQIIKDKTMYEGKKKVEQSGRTGYTARLWKIIHQKGKKDKKEQINSSYYISTPKVVRVGTKKKEKKVEEKSEEKKETEQGTTEEKKEEEASTQPATN
jgi:vancomycin resistance protein YoaR